MLEKVEFSQLPDGKILDLRPMYMNNSPLVYEEGEWVLYRGTSDQIINSRPVKKQDIDNILQ